MNENIVIDKEKRIDIIIIIENNDNVKIDDNIEVDDDVCCNIIAFHFMMFFYIISKMVKIKNSLKKLF